MMIAYSAMQNVWNRAAVGWGVGFFVLGMDLLLLQEFLGTHVIAPAEFVAVWLGAPTIFWALGRVCGECDRILGYTTVMGVFCVFPILSALTITSLLSIIILMYEMESIRLVLSFFLSAYVVGLFAEFFLIRRNIIRSDFFEKELRERGSRLFISRLPKVNPYVSNSFAKAGWATSRNVIIFLPLIIFGGYCFQRIISEEIGGIGVLLVLSVVGLPYAFHCSGRFFGGLYIWVYMIYRVEVKYGKRVYFKRAVHDHSRL